MNPLLKEFADGNLRTWQSERTSRVITCAAASSYVQKRRHCM